MIRSPVKYLNGVPQSPPKCNTYVFWVCSTENPWLQKKLPTTETLPENNCFYQKVEFSHNSCLRGAKIFPTEDFAIHMFIEILFQCWRNLSVEFLNSWMLQKTIFSAEVREKINLFFKMNLLVKAVLLACTSKESQEVYRNLLITRGSAWRGPKIFRSAKLLLREKFSSTSCSYFVKPLFFMCHTISSYDVRRFGDQFSCWQITDAAFFFLVSKELGIFDIFWSFDSVVFQCLWAHRLFIVSSLGFW